MGHGEHGKAKLRLLATPVVSRKVSPPSSQHVVLDGQKSQDHQQYDAENAHPHQINHAAMHDTPEFERVSTRRLTIFYGFRLN